MTSLTMTMTKGWRLTWKVIRVSPIQRSFYRMIPSPTAQRAIDDRSMCIWPQLLQRSIDSADATSIRDDVYSKQFRESADDRVERCSQAKGKTIPGQSDKTHNCCREVSRERKYSSASTTSESGDSYSHGRLSRDSLQLCATEKRRREEGRDAHAHNCSANRSAR